MIAPLALVLAAGASAEEAPAVPALLDSFKAACERIADFEGAKADAAAAGWVETPEDSDARIASLIATGREAVGDEGTMQGATYRADFEGRAVYLLVTRYEDESGFWGNGCRAYDLDAPAAIDAADLEQWMGKPPTGVQETFGVTKRLWEPGWRLGVGVEVSFVPAGSEIAQRLPLLGNILVAQATGGF